MQNMGMKCAAAGLSLLMVAGCQSRAVIADLEQDKVIVQLTGDDASLADYQARRGCRMHDKVASAPISQQCIDQYCIAKRILYACQAPQEPASSPSDFWPEFSDRLPPTP